jgi:hypothetical protein
MITGCIRLDTCGDGAGSNKYTRDQVPANIACQLGTPS